MKLRKGFATFLSVAAAAAFWGGLRTDLAFFTVPIALLLAAAVLVQLSSLGPQILARAVWWSTLALGDALTVLGNSNERGTGMLLGFACGGALLLAGRPVLGEDSSARAVPAALRSMLLLLMVFALADAQTFLMFGSIGLLDHGAKDVGHPPLMLGISAAYIAGFVGLYRLRLWGVTVNLAVSVLLLVLLLLLGSTFAMTSELRTFLAILALVHTLVAAPVTLAALLGKELPVLRSRLRGHGASVVVVALVLLSTVCWVKR